MNLLFLKYKNNWALYPIILILLIVFLLLNKSLSFDLLQLKNSGNSNYKLILGFITFLPLVFLIFSEYWRKQAIHKKILIIGLTAFFIAINYRIHTMYLFSAVFAVSALIYFLVERKMYRPHLFSYLLLIYLAVNALSLLWTSNFNEGLVILRHLLPYFYIPLIFCFFRLNRKDIDLILIVLFRSSMFFVFCSICSRIIQSRFFQIDIVPESFFQKITTNGLDSFTIAYAWTSFIHPTYISIILLFSLGVGWFYVFRNSTKNRVSITEMFFMIVTLLLLIVLTASRFMLVLWILVNISGILYVIRKKKKVFFVTLSVFILFSTIIITLNSAKIASFYNDPVRTCHYKAAFQSINDNTWHGTGLGGMTKYINRANPIYKAIEPIYEFPHLQPHNQFIGDLMQSGIFGLLALFVLVVYLFYNSIKYRNWLLLLFSLIFLLLMNVEMPLIYQKGIFLFCFITTFLLQLQVFRTSKQSH